MSKYTVVSAPGCASCSMAKLTLKSKGQEYEEIQISDAPLGLLDGVPAGRRELPMVFVDAEFIGSYKELIKHLKEV